MNEIARAESRPPSPYLAATHPEGGAATPSGAMFDFAHIFLVIKEWRLLILTVALAGVLLGILATVLATPMYRATVTMEANPPKIQILASDQNDASAAPSTYDFLATQIGLLKSRSVAERTAQNLKLGADPAIGGTGGSLSDRTQAAAGRVQGGLTVDMPESGQLITVNYVGSDPQRTAQIANGVADAFIETNLERHYQASDHAREFLQNQIAKTRTALEESERKLVAYQQQQGLINTATGEGQSADVSSLPGASLISLNEALAQATNQRVQAQSNYEQARLAAQSDATQSSSALNGTLANLEAEYQEKRTLLKPDHPEMVSLKSRIDELRKQIGAQQSAAAGGKVAGLLAAYRAAVSAENRLKGQVAGLKGQVLDERGRSIQLNILQRDTDTNRSLYDALLQRYKEVGVGSGIGSSPVNIVDRAQVPGGPFEPNLFKNLLLGLLGGLVAGLGLAFVLEHLNDTIRTREDVRVKLNRPCLGVVPKEKDNSALLEDFKDPASAVSEAYSAILAALRFSSDQGAPKVLAISSANASEGKSSTALALASNYARRGERTILIDSDLRRPVFKGLQHDHGLTVLLSSHDSFSRHVSATEIENLWLLPCGPIAPNPADLLSTPRFAELLADIAARFDRVIIDGPPISGMADGSFLSAAARSVLMVVESGKTRTRAAREAIERIEQTGAHLLGVAITKSTEEASRYGYGSYRYYRSIGDDDRSTIMIAQQEGK